MYKPTGVHGQKRGRVSITQILIQKSHDQLLLRATVKVAGDAIVFLAQAPMSLLQETGARAVRDQLLGLLPVVLGRLRQEHLLELLLVELARILAHFDQHLDGATNLSFFNDLTFTL